eukprot:1587956-Rhodomonas_salina.1
MPRLGQQGAGVQLICLCEDAARDLKVWAFNNGRKEGRADMWDIGIGHRRSSKSQTWDIGQRRSSKRRGTQEFFLQGQTWARPTCQIGTLQPGKKPW